MDALLTLENWGFPAIDLILMVLALVFIRHTGGIFLGLGFAATAVASASWPVSDLIMPNDVPENFYNMTTHFSFLFYVIAAAFYIAGITKLGAALQSN